MISAGLLAPLVVLFALLLAACGSSGGSSGGSGSTSGSTAAVNGTSIKIADKGFTESQIIAQLYAQALAAVGYKSSVTSLGSSQIADAAVKKGDIQMYPEYTGTAYNVLLGHTDSPGADKVDSTIKTEYAAKGLTALPPAPYSNDNRVACTQEAVDKYGMKTLSDLGKNSGNLTYSANPEHLTRKDGLPLLKSAYGVNFKSVKTVAINLRYKPVEDGQADCVYAFGTDPQIAKDKLVVLQDDKGQFQGLPYQNFAVVNTKFYSAQPAAFADTIGKVDALLTDTAVSDLNSKVDLDKQDPETVAKDFLTANNLN